MNKPQKHIMILIVDDDARNRRLLTAMVEAEGYGATTLASGQEALEFARNNPPNLMLLDLMMPGMDGYEVTRELKADPFTRSMPVVIVTSLDDRESRLRGLEAGADEFLSKPVHRTELRIRLRNLLRIKEFGDFLSHHNHILNRQVKERTRELAASYLETIKTLTRAASYKDEETGAHVTRIGLYTQVLARVMDMPAEFCDLIRYASPLHDLGKIAIPDAILGKPDGFEPHEWEIMKTHAALGAKLLSGTNSPFLVMGAEIAGSHHERWDGGGYPAKLQGEAIPMSGRIMNICDQYDALRSTRPYKTFLDHDRALEIITQGDGRTMPDHFDPGVLAAFKTCSERFRDIFDAHHN